MLIVAMLFMSVASFSQITISQEDYDRLPGGIWYWILLTIGG